MLKITIPSVELWDEAHDRFVNTKEQTFELEHSLVSLSKWESKWCKPFLGKGGLSYEETVDYIRCMSLSRNIDPKAFEYLNSDNLKEIKQYIEAPMTATTIKEQPQTRRNNEQLTAELIYYYMIALNIPFECEKWHLNRLLTLIRVCSIKNQPAKKMSRREILSQQAELNASRRNRLHSKG